MTAETLETLTPDPSLDAASFDESVLTALGGDEYVFKVWGGDWCVDCTRQLPEFAAALAAAGVPEDRIVHHPVAKTPSGKQGPGVDAYGIELIPTIVVEAADGTELARFVEEADVPIATFLARRLEEAEATA